MSQHILQTTTSQNKAVTVMAGYDRQLKGLFLIVELADSGEADDDYLYSNLSDIDLIEFGGLPPTFEHFDRVLLTHGLTIPSTMRSEILDDQRNNVETALSATKRVARSFQTLVSRRHEPIRTPERGLQN